VFYFIVLKGNDRLNVVYTLPRPSPGRRGSKEKVFMNNIIKFDFLSPWERCPKDREGKINSE